MSMALRLIYSMVFSCVCRFSVPVPSCSGSNHFSRFAILQQLLSSFLNVYSRISLIRKCSQEWSPNSLDVFPMEKLVQDRLPGVLTINTTSDENFDGVSGL